MTIKLIDSQQTHSELSGMLVTLFLKNPALTFVEYQYRYVSRQDHEDSVKTATGFEVFNNLDKVGYIEYSREGKYGIESPLINKERRPRNEYRTTNQKSAIRKALEVFKPKPVEDVVNAVADATKESIRHLKHSAFRSLPELGLEESIVFFRQYKYSDTRLPMPTSIVDKLEKETAIKSIDDYVIVKEMNDMAQKNIGHALREELNGNITVVNLSDKSLVYRGASTYELPEWMQSKVTILKLLNKNQAARNIGAKMEDGRSVFYYIVDGEIPDLIE